MSLFIQNNYGTINHIEKSVVTISNGQTKVEPEPQPEPQIEEVQPEPVESIIFTSKAKQEGEIAAIIQALQQSLSRRNDKARALVEKVRLWQKEGYIDPNYNARVMYDELNRILTLPFQYGGFRKYYNK